jgi:integrase
MPIKLIPPRQNADGSQFSPFYYGRGTHLGVFVDRSTRAVRPALARRVIKNWEEQIERGVFNADTDGAPTFLSAAIAYKKSGGDERPVAKLIAHFGEAPLRPVDLARDVTLQQHWQGKLDTAALELFPDHSPATRNREVYTPASAILKGGGLDFAIKRPKGSRGRKLLGFLFVDKAELLIAECFKVDAEFGLLCYFLLYTGLRLSEGLSWFEVDKLILAEAYAFVPETKNGDPRPVHLPAHVVAALANHPRGLDRPGERVFRFHKGGALYDMLYKAAINAGIELPDREAFHIFRHTYGAWMRRYGGADTSDLVASGTWKSEQAARRYEHVVVSEAAKLSDLMPVVKLKAG